MKTRMLLIALSIFTVASALRAGDYYVNAVTGSNSPTNGTFANPWKTITYALGQISGTGHTVYIAPGTYNAVLGEVFPILMENGVSLVGSDANLCIVDAAGANTVIRCVSITNATTKIEGLTLKGGGNVTYGGGLYVSAGSVLTITKCRINSNMLGSDVEYGGGVYILNASPVLLNDTLSGNKSGAIYVDNGSPLIKGNSIVINQGVRTSGIFVTGASSTPRIVGNIIAKNTSSVSTMYGIVCSSSSHARIVNNTVSDNVGGIFIDGASPDSIENNIISFNNYYGIIENTFTSDPGRAGYNLFFQNGSGLYRNENTTDYFSDSTLNASVTECSANLEGDPKFQDRTNGDYRLGVGSAAFDAGNPDTSFNDPEGTRGDIGALYLNAPPAAPANFTATRGNAQVDLKWRVNSEPDVARYRVYYGTTPAPTTKMDSTSSKSDTAKTYSLTNNVTYYFRVTAVDAAGNESGYSSEVSATPVAAEHGEYLPDIHTVLLMHMNETSGATVDDASTNGNNGTATGTAIGNGRFGNARNYSNSGDEIRINSASSLNFGIGSFTLETWVNLMGYTPSGHPHYKEGSPNNRSWGTWFNSDGTFGAWVANNAGEFSSQASGPTRINDARWHHVGAVITQSSICTYVDGVLDASATVTTQGTPDNDGQLVLGSSWNNFRGILDEVRISNIARTPEEFDVQLPPKNLTANASGTSISLTWQNGGGLAPFMRYRIYRGTDSTNVSLIDSTNQLSRVNSGLASGTRYFYRVAAVDSFCYEYAKSYAANAVTSPALGEYSPDANTVLLLHMNESAGSPVTDASASNNNGSANGTTVVNGRIGTCRNYSADGDQINIPNSPTLDFGAGPFTLETWINTQTYTMDGAHPFHKRGSPNNRGWFTQVYTDGTTGGWIANVSDQNGFGFGGRARINDGKWHHIAVVVTQTLVTTYVDGSLDNVSTVWTAGTPDNDGTLNIGSSWNQYRGLIDEIRISNKARTPEEFNLQLPPKNCTALASSSSITLNWQQGGGLNPLMGYRIYRGTDSVNVSLLDSTEELNYEDPRATPGTFYYYRIAAVDSTGFESAKSNAIYSEVTLAGEYQVDTSTVFLMHLNQTGGINVGDVGRKGYHGQFNGGSFVPGRFGNAFRPTSSAGVWTQTFSTIGMESQFTVEAWMKLTGQPTCGGCCFLCLPWMSFSMGPDGNFWYNLTLADYSGRGLGSGNTYLTVGKWYHLAYVFDTGKASIFLNGILVSADSYGQSVRTGSGGFNIVNYNAPDVFPGLIDEVRVSKIARNPSEFGLQLPPTNLRATQAGSSVRLQWANGGGGVPCMRYRIYRGADSVNVSAIDSTASTSFDDIKAVQGTSYVYRIAAVDSTGFEGTMSRPIGYSVPLTGEYQIDSSTVFLMHMNQSGGSIVTDVGPYGYHGQANGGSFVTGKFGRAYRPGTSNGLWVSNFTWVGLENKLTMEVWVKLENRPIAYANIVSIAGIGINTNQDCWLSFDFQLADGSGRNVTTPNNTLAIGKWYHIAGIYENGIASLYVNGVCRSTQSFGQSLRTGTGSGVIGYSNDQQIFTGIIDEVMISNIARAPNDFGLQLPPKNVALSRTNSEVHLQWQNGGGKISCMRYKIYRGTDSLNVSVIDSTNDLSYDDRNISAGDFYCYKVSAVDSTGFENNEGHTVFISIPVIGEYEPDTSTVLLMHLNQPGASVAYDVSSNGYHGRLNTGSFVAGRFGKSYQPASTNGIYLQNIPTTGLETQYTLEAWVKLNKTPDDWCDIFGLPWMNFGVNPDLSLGGGFTLADGSGQGIGTSSNILTIGKWHHIARTHENGIARIYVDGVVVSMRSYGQSLRMGGGGGSFATSNNNNIFPGCVDEIRVSRIARQPEQFGLQLQPKELTAVNIGSTVQLAWKNGGGGIPFMRYKVYRGTDSLTVAFIDSTVDITYNDRNVLSGQFYCYRITSVDSSGYEGAPSSAAFATARVKGEYASDTSTVLLMHMDQSSGLGIYDESKNNYHGQISSGSFIPGRFGNAFQPGNSDGMWFRSMSTVGMEDQFTIELWVKYANLQNRGCSIINIPWMSMYVNPDFSFNIGFSLEDGSGAGAWSPSFVMSVGKWYHLAGVFDDGTTKIYVNGVPCDSRYYDQSARTSPGGGSIGSFDYPDVLPALIDEVRISRVARRPEEFGLQLPVKNLAVTVNSASIGLSWQNGGGAVPCMRYKIYRGTDSLNVAAIDSTVNLSYADASAVRGTFYFYRVATVDSTGFEGAKSVALTATMTTMGEYQPDTSTVLLMHLNETNATTVFDASKYRNHGRLDRTTAGSGRFGGARQFDDQSNIGFSYSPSLNVGDADFTLEAWLKAGPQPNWICFMQKWESNHGLQFYLNGGSGSPTIQLRDESGTQRFVTGGSGLYDSKWHHVAAVRKNNILSLLVDGACEDSVDVTPVGSVMGWGALNFQTGTYLLDEIRISNRARAPEEFDLQLPPKSLHVVSNASGVSLTWEQQGGVVPLSRYKIYRGFDPNNMTALDSTVSTSYQDKDLFPGAKYYYRVSSVDSTGFESAKCSAGSIISSLAVGEYAPDSSTVLLLHMDEQSGSNVGDASNSNNDGKATGTTVVAGRFGKARSYGASGDQIDVPDSTSLNFGTGSFTLEAWINTLGFTPTGHPHYKAGSPNNRSWGTWLNNDGTFGAWVCNVSDQYGSSTSSTRRINDGRWHHIAAVITQSLISVYLDGVLESSSSVTMQGSPDNDGQLTIGSSWNNFRGLLDEVRISKKARVPQEFNLQLRPLNLTAGISATSISLSWQNGGGSCPLMRYRIYRGADSTAITQIDSTTSTSYVNAGLAVGTKYFYRIAAIDSSGFESVKSYATSATTQNIPSAPSGLTAAAVSYSKINLSWTDNSSNEDGFKIDRKTGTSGTYAQIATVGAGIKTYQDTGLTATTQYFYRVSAYNGAGTSASSTEANATTPVAPDVTAPASPIFPTISSATWTRSEVYAISWTNPADASGIAKVWYRYDYPPKTDTLGASLAITVSSGIASAQVPAPATCGVHSLYFYLEDGATPSGNKNPNSCVSVIARHDDMLPCITHDSLSVATFNVSSPLDITIQATASDAHSGVKSLQLQYRKAGDSWDTPHMVNYSGTGGNALIHASDITAYSNSGVDYRIICTDTADNVCVTPTHSLLIQHTKTFVRLDLSGNTVTQMSVSQLPANVSSQLAYRMFSVPLQLNDETPRRVLEVETGLGTYDDKQWRFFRLNANNGYDEYPTFADESVIKPGSAFFLILNAGKAPKAGTGTIVKSEDLNKNGIQLRAGYNFIGNPFNFSIPIDSLSLSTGDSLNNRWEFVGVSGTNSGWSPRPAALKPWEGIVLKLTRAAVLRFNIADRPKSSVAPTFLTSRKQASDGGSGNTKPWVLRVTAARRDNGLVDSENLFGVDQQATDSLDILDLVEPPMIGDKGLSLYSRSANEDLTYDYREPGKDGYVWDLIVRTPDRAAKILLGFEGLDEIANETFLIDVDSKITYRPKYSNTIEVNSGNGGRHMRLIVGDLAFAEKNSLGVDVIPKQFVLYQNYPNPFNPETMIRYTLPNSEKRYRVSLKVYNILGNEIVTLVDRDQSAGYYEAKFDGRRVSSGTYFYRILINGGSKESTFSDVKKFVLIK